MIEKSLGSTRSGTKTNSTAAIMWFVELDTPGPVIEELVSFLTHRIPKLVAGVTAALTEVFREFGAKTASPKPIIKVLPKLFAHADKNVRKETTELVVELYKWLGDGFKDTFFADLKPVQQKDLEAEFEKVKDVAPQQKRFLKSQQAEMQANGEGDDEDEEDNEDAGLDLLDPVEVLSKVPANFASNLGSSKWKDRKEALEEFYPAVNVPKIKADDYGDIVRLLSKCMKDANIQVVTLAANCIESFAKGLRSDFSRYVAYVMGPMLERLKEKKASVADALRNALDAVYKTCSLSEILDDILESLKHKTPQVKIETAKFLSRCLSTTKVTPKPAEIKLINEASIKLLGETQEPVRAGGAEVLGIVMKIIGERAMTPFLESVDDIKKGKITEFYNKAEVKAKPSKAAPPAAGPAAAGPKSVSRPATGTRPGSTLLRKKGPADLASSAKSRQEEEPMTPTPRPSRLGVGTKTPLQRPGVTSPTKQRAAEALSQPPALSQRPAASASRGLTARVSFINTFYCFTLSLTI